MPGKERDDSRGRKPNDSGEADTKIAGPAVNQTGLDNEIRCVDQPKASGFGNEKKSKIVGTGQPE